MKLKKKKGYVHGIYNDDNMGDGIEDDKYVILNTVVFSVRVDFFHFCPGRTKSESGLALLLRPAHTNGI